MHNARKKWLLFAFIYFTFFPTRYCCFKQKICSSMGKLNRCRPNECWKCVILLVIPCRNTPLFSCCGLFSVDCFRPFVVFFCECVSNGVLNALSPNWTAELKWPSSVFIVYWMQQQKSLAKIIFVGSFGINCSLLDGNISRKQLHDFNAYKSKFLFWW